MERRATIRERAFQFGLGVMRIVPAVRGLGPEFLPVADQLSRSATAVGALLEEGATAESRRDMAHKHRLALREARESAYWLRLARERGGNREALIPLEREANELSAMLATSVKKLQLPRRT
jgi:four helix bundle protein